jgi:hypothetical protein
MSNDSEWDEAREAAAAVVAKAPETPWGTLAEVNDGVTTVADLDEHQFHPWGRNVPVVASDAT